MSDYVKIARHSPLGQRLLLYVKVQVVNKLEVDIQKVSFTELYKLADYIVSAKENKILKSRLPLVEILDKVTGVNDWMNY